MDEVEVESQAVLRPAFMFLSYVLSLVDHTFSKIPGSAVLVRYVKSSHQNDPGRTLLEVILIIYAIRTLLQSRTRATTGGGKFVQLTEKVRAHAISFLRVSD